MNKLAIVSLLLCFASLSHALKDCRVWVKNNSGVPLVVEGWYDPKEVRVLPGFAGARVHKQGGRASHSGCTHRC